VDALGDTGAWLAGITRRKVTDFAGRGPPWTSTCCRGMTRSSGWRWWRAWCTPRGCGPAMTARDAVQAGGGECETGRGGTGGDPAAPARGLRTA